MNHLSCKAICSFSFYFVVVRILNMRYTFLNLYVYNTLLLIGIILYSRFLELIDLAWLKFYAPLVTPQLSLIPSPLATILFFDFMNLTILDTSHKWNHTLMMLSQSSFMLSHISKFLSFFIGCILFLVCIYHIFFVHILMGVLVVFTSWLLWIEL